MKHVVDDAQRQFSHLDDRINVAEFGHFVVQIAAYAEGSTRAGDDDDPNLRVGLYRQPNLCKLVMQHVVGGIQLFRAIYGYQKDPVRPVIEFQKLVFLVPHHSTPALVISSAKTSSVRSRRSARSSICSSVMISGGQTTDHSP